MMFRIPSKKAIAIAALMYALAAAACISTLNNLRASMRHADNDTAVVHRHLIATTATRTVLILRVSSPSTGPPTISSDELYRNVFTDYSSLMNQMARCSGGQVQLAPTDYGVLNVQIDGVDQNTSRNDFIDKAKIAALYYVSSSFTDIRQVADHIIIVMPDRADGFVATGEVSLTQEHTFANYGDKYAAYLSLLMHETGHNLGLDHASWNDKEYGDITGNMGASSAESGGPLSCYNAANHWSLEWFRDSRLDLEPRYRPIKVTIPSFVDYREVAAVSDKFVLVKIGTLYIQYNRAKGHNIGTRSMPDKLVLVQYTGAGFSYLISALDMQNPTYTDSNVSIRVCSVETSGSVDYMVVSIGKSRTNCDAATKATISGWWTSWLPPPSPESTGDAQSNSNWWSRWN